MRNNTAHELLAKLYMERNMGIDRCETDAEVIDFLMSFTQAMGIFTAKHMSRISEEYGRKMAVDFFADFIMSFGESDSSGALLDDMKKLMKSEQQKTDIN